LLFLALPKDVVVHVGSVLVDHQVQDGVATQIVSIRKSGTPVQQRVHNVPLVKASSKGQRKPTHVHLFTKEIPSALKIGVCFLLGFARLSLNGQAQQKLDCLEIPVDNGENEGCLSKILIAGELGVDEPAFLDLCLFAELVLCGDVPGNFEVLEETGYVENSLAKDTTLINFLGIF